MWDTNCFIILTHLPEGSTLVRAFIRRVQEENDNNRALALYFGHNIKFKVGMS